MTEDEMMALNAQPMPSEYARTMRAYINKHPAIVKSAKQGRPAWALPTTGNLAFDDYRRAEDAWMKAHPYAGTEQYDSRGVQDLMSGGIDSLSGINVDRNAWDLKQRQGFGATLTPEQAAERKQLGAERNARLRRNGQLAAIAAFGGIAGAGMLGAGMLGAGGFGGAGAAAGGDLGMAGWMGAGAGEMGLEAGAAGLASSGAGGALGAAGGAAELGGGFSALDGLGGLGQFGGLDSMAGTGGLGSGLEAASGGLGGLGAGGAGSGGFDIGSLIKQYGGTVSDWTSLLGGGGGKTNWLNLLGNLGGGLINSYTAGKASDAQVNSAQEANALLKYMYDQSRADQAPYRQAGTSALAGIQRLLSDPSSITAMPDYQFGLDQGTKALNNSASARGMTYSGQQGKALQKWGNDYAGTKLNESYNRLAGIAGIGQQATNQSGVLGANYANNASQNLTDMGNARGAGYIGQGSAWNNAIGGALNGLSEQDLINALLRGGN